MSHIACPVCEQATPCDCGHDESLGLENLPWRSWRVCTWTGGRLLSLGVVLERHQIAAAREAGRRYGAHRLASLVVLPAGSDAYARALTGPPPRASILPAGNTQVPHGPRGLGSDRTTEGEPAPD